jgi:hypothetical protein
MSNQLNPERTDLAWRRTVLTATVAALLGVRGAVVHWPGPVAALAVAALGAAVGLIALVGRRRGDVLAAGPVRILTHRVWITTAATLALAAIGLASVLRP